MILSYNNQPLPSRLALTAYLITTPLLLNFAQLAENFSLGQYKIPDNGSLIIKVRGFIWLPIKPTKVLVCSPFHASIVSPDGVFQESFLAGSTTPQNSTGLPFATSAIIFSKVQFVKLSESGRHFLAARASAPNRLHSRSYFASH